MAIFYDQPATGLYTGEKTFFGGFPLTRKLLFLFTLCFALAIGGVGALADNPSVNINTCLLYTSPSPRDRQKSRMPSSA